jgi:hypothetical protein
MFMWVIIRLNTRVAVAFLLGLGFVFTSNDRIDRDALSHNTSEEMAQVQQDIFQLNVFKKLGALECQVSGTVIT